MKKLILSAFATVAVFMTRILSTVSASAYYCHYEDFEDDYCCVYYEPDFVNGTATVTGGYPTDDGEFIIPEYVSCWDNEDSYRKLTVNSITNGAGFNSSIKYIKIPATVKKIEPHSVGYTTYYIYNSDGTYEIQYKKINNFTIACVAGSYAEIYANENGFQVAFVKDIGDLSITLDKASYTYNGDEIEPYVTITDGSNKLVCDEDYYLTYDNNINAGTGTVIVNGLGDYCGNKEIQFTINPVQASALTISGIENSEYSGYEIEQWFDVLFGDIYLHENSDYTVSYRNNCYPGTAYVDISFKGNYTGTRTVSFTIYLGTVTGLKAEAYSYSSVYLTWDWLRNTDYYFIYRYDTDTQKYVYLAKTASCYYYDNKLSQYTAYKYQVVPVVYDSNGKVIKGDTVYVSCRTLLKAPTIELTTLKSSVKINYKKNSKADGFVIYRQRIDDYSELKAIKTITSNAAGSYTDKSIDKNGVYAYCIRPYKSVNGEKVYGEYGSQYYTNDADAVLRGASLKSGTSFKVYNKQGKTTTSYTYTLSENDIKILKKFADKHFKKSMTEEEKLSYTLYWINENVTYALGDDWTKISGKSWVEATFKYKIGQCAQYNGAMAAMMVYLGYDAYVVQGYRGSYPSNYWQHFWCEVKIQGRKYLMETGNYGRSGYWSYFLAPYTYTSGYIVNRTAAEIAYAEPGVSSVTLSKTKYTYNGKVKKPTVVAKDNKGNTLTEGKDYTVKYESGRKKVGTYTVTVKFKGDYSGTKKLTFKIVPKSTSITTLKAGSKKFTVKWKEKSTQVTGYQIEYSTSSKMSNSNKVTVKDSSTTSKTISKLKKGKKYYVRVRTYKTVDGKKIYSSWSEIKSVKVK